MLFAVMQCQCHDEPRRSAQCQGIDHGLPRARPRGQCVTLIRSVAPSVRRRSWLFRPRPSRDRRGRRRNDSPLSDRRSTGGDRRATAACSHDAVAGPGNRHRPVAGCSAGEAPLACRVLGQRLRLAEGRGEAQRAAAVHHRNRRPGHPVCAHPLTQRRPCRCS
jgi:hypothetical protein